MSPDREPAVGPFTAAELAAALGAEVEGDPEVRLVDVRGLSDAGPEHLSFFANPKFSRDLAATGAGAVLIAPGVEAEGRTLLRVDDPYTAFARALARFHPQPWPESGIDPQAHVDGSAEVSPEATVEAFAWIGPGAKVGAGSWIEAGAYVGRGAEIGERCRLMPGSVVCAGCVLGDRVWLNPSAVIGAEGFGFAPGRERHTKIPQVGRAVIGDDVEVGANSCIDRGAIGDTEVHAGVKLDNLVQVAHGTVLGERVLMAAYAGIAGSAKLGKDVVVAAKAGVINHLTIGDGSQIATQSIALSDHPPGSQLAGTPAIDRRVWLRASAALPKLPDLLRQVRRLEKRVAELEARLAEDD